MKITVDPESIATLADWLSGADTGEDGLDIETSGGGLQLTIGLASCEITSAGTVLPE
jgi:hypothetical protein